MLYTFLQFVFLKTSLTPYPYVADKKTLNLCVKAVVLAAIKLATLHTPHSRDNIPF